MQTLLTCVFYFKSFVIVTPRYLMLSTFLRLVPAKVYKAWIFLIRFLVSWHIEISYLISLSSNPIYTPLKFHCVFFILSFAIANAVISEKSYFRLSIWCDINNVKREQQGTKNSALGDTRQNLGPVCLHSITTTRCCLKHRKESIHFNVLPPIP